MRNLLLVANYRPDVGYAWWLMERFWVLLARDMAAAGGRTFLAYPEAGTVPSAIIESPIEVLTLAVPTSGIADGQVLRTIRENQIGALYLTDRPFRAWSYGSYRSAGISTIVTHDHTPGDRPYATGLRGAVKAVVNSWSKITADRLIALSPLMRDRAINNGRVPPKRIVVVPNGIDADLEVSVDRLAVRRMLNISADAFVVTSVGRAHRYKGIHRILAAVASARERSARRIVYVHVGDGPHLEEFRQLAIQLRIPSEDCRFLGARTDTAQLLPAFDVAVHASDGEGFSLSILEYMRAGLAVIVSDQPSVAQAITHGHDGFVFDREQPEDAARYILRLVENELVRMSFAAAARKTVAERYSWARTRQEFSAVSQWLIGRCR